MWKLSYCVTHLTLRSDRNHVTSAEQLYSLVIFKATFSAKLSMNRIRFDETCHWRDCLNQVGLSYFKKQFPKVNWHVFRPTHSRKWMNYLGECFFMSETQRNHVTRIRKTYRYSCSISSCYFLFNYGENVIFTLLNVGIPCQTMRELRVNVQVTVRCHRLTIPAGLLDWGMHETQPNASIDISTPAYG